MMWQVEIKIIMLILQADICGVIDADIQTQVKSLRLIRAYFVNVVIALILNKELEIPKQKSLIPCHI